MSGLDEYPKIHKREMHVQGASADISLACIKLVAKHGLTDVEWLQTLNGMTASCLKYMLREERHGDANKPAGLE